MDHSYTKTIWEDAPSTETPLSAENLNHLENGLAALYADVLALETRVDGMTTGGSHVGMVIMSTTLDNEDDVIAIYGGTAWSRIEGKFLLGSSSDYPIGSTGGNADAIVPQHVHTLDTMYQKVNNLVNLPTSLASGSVSVDIPIDLDKEMVLYGASTNAPSGSESVTGKNMPPYKAVYIWERTA